MKADPRNIAFCPYTVYVFETVADPGVTRLGYRVASWPGPEESNQALDEINELLDDIVRVAAE